MALKPLGILKEVVESAGMGISYAYDDLVFPDHNGFLMQFSDDGNKVTVHINTEADRKEVGQAIKKLKSFATPTSLEISVGNFYTLYQADDETISIEFHEKA